MKKTLCIMGAVFSCGMIIMVSFTLMVLLPARKPAKEPVTSDSIDTIGSLANAQLEIDMAAETYQITHRSIMIDTQADTIVTVSYEIKYIVADGAKQCDNLQYRIAYDPASGLCSFV